MLILLLLLRYFAQVQYWNVWLQHNTIIFVLTMCSSLGALDYYTDNNFYNSAILIRMIIIIYDYFIFQRLSNRKWNTQRCISIIWSSHETETSGCSTTPLSFTSQCARLAHQTIIMRIIYSSIIIFVL